MKKKPYQEIKPGTKYGMLTVIKCVGYQDFVKSRINYYLCQCECGQTKKIRRNHLLAGKTVSCGCYRRSINLKPPGDISYSSLYNICKHSAGARNIEFSLSRAQHESIINNNCYYCNKPPQYFNVNLKVDRSPKIYRPIDSERAAIYVNGVDRVDSNLGYTLDNCVPCCTDCNRAKWELSVDKFIDHCYQIVAYQEAKKKASA